MDHIGQLGLAIGQLIAIGIIAFLIVRYIKNRRKNKVEQQERQKYYDQVDRTSYPR